MQARPANRMVSITICYLLFCQFINQTEKNERDSTSNSQVKDVNDANAVNPLLGCSNLLRTPKRNK